jgi:hypothetical protein
MTIASDVFAALSWEFDRVVRIARLAEIYGKIGLINMLLRISAFASGRVAATVDRLLFSRVRYLRSYLFIGNARRSPHQS